MPIPTDKIILEKFKSDCEPKQKRIISRDKKHQYQHIGDNKSGGHVRHYKIDGVVLPKGEKPDRCDFLLLADDTNPPTAYFIELKGSPSYADKCVEQVLKTESMCRDSIKGYRTQYRFIFGKGSGFYSSKFTAWRDKQPKGKVVAVRKDYTDTF